MFQARVQAQAVQRIGEQEVIYLAAPEGPGDPVDASDNGAGVRNAQASLVVTDPAQLGAVSVGDLFEMTFAAVVAANAGDGGQHDGQTPGQ